MRLRSLARALVLASLPSLVLGAAGCRSGRPAAPVGCGRDVDCKGARICVRGSCVDPPAASPALAPRVALAVDAAPAVAVTPVAQTASSTRSQEAPRVASPPPAPPIPLPPPITLPGASPVFHADWGHTGRSRFRVATSAPREIGRAPTSGAVYSSPAITDDGVAIFGSHDRQVRAVALDDKKPHHVDVRWTHATSDLVWCSPALGPGGPNEKAAVAYVGSDDDRLYALDAASGHVRWSYTAGPCRRATGVGPEAARCDIDGVTVGPDGTIYFVADGAYALRPDGTLRFRFPLNTHCASAPAIGPDRTVYFGCQDGRLYALAPDGTKRWDYPTGDDIDSSPAVAADGTIYVGSDDHKLYAFTPAGVVRFALQTGGAIRSSPAIAADGIVYVGSLDASLYAVRPDGSVVWTFRTADRILASPVVDAAGTVLIGSEDDRLYALAPDGKLLWSLLLGGDVDATPAIGPDGTIWVGADDKALHVLK
jgi:outer membrane protein assembly factor BamB